MNVLPFETQVRVVSALVEGVSIRGVSRLTGAHRDTIGRLALEAGGGCAAMHDALVRNVYVDRIECDEIWSFVGKKEKRVKETDPAEYGDQYTFVGMEANTKFVVSYLTGKRTPENTNVFVADLRARVIGKPQISTDGWGPYVAAFEAAFGADCHYAQVIKSFEGDSTKQDAAHRYSPGKVVNIAKYKMIGSPAEEFISTSLVERQNLTMRMMMRRFTRLTNGFSKRLPNLKAAVALHFGIYNFCRIHETLRVTPAMAAGLTDHVWTLSELMSFVLTIPTQMSPNTSTMAA